LGRAWVFAALPLYQKTAKLAAQNEAICLEIGFLHQPMGRAAKMLIKRAATIIAPTPQPSLITHHRSHASAANLA
jgi:hypothetical protein